MKAYIISLLIVVIIFLGCSATSKYEVGNKIPGEQPLHRCSSFITPQEFELDDLSIIIRPDDTSANLLIIIEKPNTSKVETTVLKPCDLKIYIAYINADRTVVHVIHKRKSVIGFPIQFVEPIPTNLDVKYITAGYSVRWYY